MKNRLEFKIIGTVIIVVVLSLLIHNSRPKINLSTLTLNWFWVNKTHFLQQSNIIFLGDSRVYRGISTNAVNTIFPNQRIINLGYSSGGLNKTMFEFAYEKLDTSKTIKIIILGVSPLSLTKDARKNIQYFQELNRPKGEILERKYLNPILGFFEPIKLTNYIKKTHISTYYQHFTNNGWTKSEKIPYDSTEALKPYLKILEKTQLSNKSIEEMANFILSMTQKGVKIYGFRPPSTQAMEKLENKLLQFNEDKIKRLFIKNGGKWITIPNRFSYNSYDGSHLHYKSAEKLSVLLAKKIKSL